MTIILVVLIALALIDLLFIAAIACAVWQDRKAEEPEPVLVNGYGRSFDERQQMLNNLLDDLYPCHTLHAEQFAEEIPANLADGLRFSSTRLGIVANIDTSTN